jgi:hypothetical protein
MPNTVIALLSSGESGNTPSLGVLANGELALNYADSVLYFKTTSNSLGSIRTTEPSGLDGEIQYNDSGVLGSNGSLTFDKTTGVFSTSNVTSESIATNTYIQFSDGTKQYTANAGTGGGGGTSISVTFDDEPPVSGNSNGDIWVESTTGIKFEYITDDDSSQWVEFGTNSSGNELDLTAITTDVVPTTSTYFNLGSNINKWNDFYIGGKISGNLIPKITNTFDLGSESFSWKNIHISGEVTGNLVPSNNVSFDLGSSSKRWKDIYLSGNTIDMNGSKISILPNNIISIVPAPSENVPNPKAFIFTPSGIVSYVNTSNGIISESTTANIAITTSESLFSLSSNLTSNVSIRPGKNYMAIGPLVIENGVEIIIEEGGELTIV